MTFPDLCIMSLRIASLNSGSNGNCYFIGSAQDAVLIDAGISRREIIRRMSHLGLSPEMVRAIFISHEHSDHIRGVEVLSRRQRIPVYITDETHKSSRVRLEPELKRRFSPGEKVVLGDLVIEPFSKRHDSSDPHSFTVSSGSVTVGVFTDIGAVCENVARHFAKCHAAFLETNYDEVMLEKGWYPLNLKRRIRGGHGHLSNRQALNLFTGFRAPYLQLLVLSHLSKINNDPEIVRDLFRPHANGTRIEVASRYGETELLTVTSLSSGSRVG
jgi:phosphoribosyl 1,2-cyclic phosphodiesterase